MYTPYNSSLFSLSLPHTHPNTHPSSPNPKWALITLHDKHQTLSTYDCPSICILPLLPALSQLAWIIDSAYAEQKYHNTQIMSFFLDLNCPSSFGCHLISLWFLSKSCCHSNQAWITDVDNTGGNILVPSSSQILMSDYIFDTSFFLACFLIWLSLYLSSLYISTIFLFEHESWLRSRRKLHSIRLRDLEVWWIALAHRQAKCSADCLV